MINRRKMFSVVLAFYPLLSMYGLGSISFGDILLIIALLIGKPPREDRIQWSRFPVYMLWVYMLWCLIGITLNMFRADFLLGNMIKRVIKMGLYLIMITASTKLLDRHQFVKCYRYLVYLTFAALVVQYVAYYGLGRIIVVKIPFLPYSGVVTAEGIYTHLVYQFRPGSLYSEPAACCYVLLPFFAYTMFSEKKDKSRRWDLVVSLISILLTVSSAGIVCCLIILGMYYCNMVMTKRISLQRKVLILIGSGALLVAGIWLYSKTPLYYAMERMQRTEENKILADVVWGKTNAGSELLGSLNWWTSWCGMGFGNLSMAKLSDYTNSINYILYCTGYIGMAILVCWVFSVFVQSKRAGKATILVFGALCIASRIFISSSIMMYAVFCLIDDKQMDAVETENGVTASQMQ